MKMKNCYACGHEVAPRAKACPNCGARNPSKAAWEAKLDDIGAGLRQLGAALIGLPILALIIYIAVQIVLG